MLDYNLDSDDEMETVSVMVVDEAGNLVPVTTESEVPVQNELVSCDERGASQVVRQVEGRESCEIALDMADYNSSEEFQYASQVVRQVEGEREEANISHRGVEVGNGDTVKKKRRKKRCPLRKREQRDQMKAKKDDRRKKYDKAIAAYLRGKYDSYRSCASAYAVNASMLRQFILEGKSYTGAGPVSTVLNEEEEQELAEHIKVMSSLGFGFTYYDVRLLAYWLTYKN